MRRLLEVLAEMKRLQRALWIVASGALLLTFGIDWWRSREAEPPAAPTESNAPAAESGAPHPRGDHRVIVRVIDAGGEPVRGARVYAPPPKATPRAPATPAVEFEPGRHAFSGLEDGKVEIVVELAGDRIRFMHPTDTPTAVIPVPTGGRVAVNWSLPPNLDLARGHVILALEPASEDTDRFEVPVPPGPGNRGSLMVPYVVPGSYLAHLEFWQEATLATEHAAVVPLTAPIELAVEPRTLTRIALGLGSDTPSPAPPGPAPTTPAAAPAPAARPPATAPAARPAPAAPAAPRRPAPSPPPGPPAAAPAPTD